MSFFRFATLATVLSALCIAAEAAELPRPIAHPIPAPPVLQIINTSGYIFQGTVTQLRWLKPANSEDVATMQITFRVSQGIRGVQAGQMLSVKEWAGLWDSNERYRVGQNVVLFLYRPSKLGLTSPVSGALGKFVVSIGGIIRLDQQQRNFLASEPTFGPGIRTRAEINAKSFANTIRRLAGGQFSEERLPEEGISEERHAQ
jgi:hypothetical protein